MYLGITHCGGMVDTGWALISLNGEIFNAGTAPFFRRPFGKMCSGLKWLVQTLCEGRNSLILQLFIHFFFKSGSLGNLKDSVNYLKTTTVFSIIY